MAKVLVVYYTRYGHTAQLATAVAEGAGSVDGTEVVVRRVAEFEDEVAEIAKSEHAKKVWDDQQNIPVCTVEDLRDANAVLFGTPTRYGNMAAQMKRLIDSTVSLWAKGEMEGKPAGVFTSTATTHGGQETTALTMMVPLLHLGMLVVGVPYSVQGMTHSEARGGSPYGASVIAGGKGELQPLEGDLIIAKALGARVSGIAKKLFK